MGNVLYLDCASGISGDMFAAALLDLGASEARLRDALASLPLEGYEVRVSRVKKAGIDCCDFDVVLDEAHENHDHDMAYLHGDTGGHDHLDHHAHGCHEHHEHRGPADIDAIIDAGQLAPRACEVAHRMVRVLAEAEAKAHAVPLDQVHFHEVGAVDSIVDIVAAAVLLDDLDIDRVIVPVLVDGCGTIRCQHGIIPVPVPATLNIVQAHGIPLSICKVTGELVTPTGAAIVAATRAEHVLPARFCVRRTGLGAGKRTYEQHVEHALPTLDAAYEGPVVRLECDIDDTSGEVLAYAAERLRAAGAREVHWAPIFGKKGRPAWQLQVIALPEDVERLEAMIFAETTTIGVRRWTCDRTVLAREETVLETPWGPVRAKRVVLPDGTVRTRPEYEDAATIARREGIALQQVMAAMPSA